MPPPSPPSRAVWGLPHGPGAVGADTYTPPSGSQPGTPYPPAAWAAPHDPGVETSSAAAAPVPTLFKVADPVAPVDVLTTSANGRALRAVPIVSANSVVVIDDFTSTLQQHFTMHNHSRDNSYSQFVEMCFETQGTAVDEVLDRVPRDWHDSSVESYPCHRTK